MESYDKLRQCVEKQRHYSDDKGSYSQGYGLPSGHVWLWELYNKEGGALKNWYLWTMVLEKTPESPLDSKEIKPVNLERNQLWILTGRTYVEGETPVFWSSDVNSWLIGKSLMLGKIVGRRRRGRQRMRWTDHWCHLHELGQTSGDGERQGGLVCCSPWGRKEAEFTGQLNNHFMNNTTTKFDNLDEINKFLERCLI